MLDEAVVGLDSPIPMYAPKRSCPRDLGFWYCDECEAKYAESAWWNDVGACLRKQGCGIEDERGRTCGKTHLGYEWCEECKAKDRLTHPHIGEYEIVAQIKS